MREVQVLKWCDTCDAEGDPEGEPVRVTAVATWTVGLIMGETRPTPHIVELCEQHNKTFADLLALVGRTPAARAEDLDRPKPKPKAAVIRPMGTTATTAAGALPPPQLQFTGAPIPGQIGRRGAGPNGEYTKPRADCPVCGRDLATTSITLHVYNVHLGESTKPPVPLNCPECGRRSTSPLAAAMHRRETHGWDPLAEAVALVDARGDYNLRQREG